MNKIALLGSGTFALSFLEVLDKKDNALTLWSPDKNFKKKLKNATLTYDLLESVKDKDYIFILVSSKYLGSLLNTLLKLDLTEKVLFIGTKGLLQEESYYLSDFLEKHSLTYTIFGGPNLASELLKKSPTTISFSSNYMESKKIVENIFPNWIQPLYVKNPHHLELCNVLKNIYAIGSGMLYSYYPFLNTHFSYINKVILELQNLLKEDIYPFLGDVLLTSSMKDSRNYTYGLLFSNKKKKDKFLKNNTVEGLENLEYVKKVLEKEGLCAPIFLSIYESIKEDSISPKLKEVIFWS